jgi:hypothetical protein
MQKRHLKMAKLTQNNKGLFFNFFVDNVFSECRIVLFKLKFFFNSLFVAHIVTNVFTFRAFYFDQMFL